MIRRYLELILGFCIGATFALHMAKGEILLCVADMLILAAAMGLWMILIANEGGSDDTENRI